MNIRNWFRMAHRRLPDRRQVAADYARLGGMPKLLADIALRGGVFQPAPPARDLWEAGIAEGRRQFALETIRIAGTDPAALQAYCLDQPHREPRS